MAMICRTAAQCGPWAFLCLRLSAYGPRCNRWRTTKELASGTPRRRSTSGPRTRSRHSRSDATVRDRGRPDMEYAMASHKFQVGEIVNLRPIVSRNVPGGAYEVTKQLPHRGASSNIESRVPAKSTSASLEKATLPGHRVRRVRHCGPFKNNSGLLHAGHGLTDRHTILRLSIGRVYCP